MAASIPEKMKHIKLSKFGDLSAQDLSDFVGTGELEVPKPKEGEVLVKMAFGSINPADLMSLEGKYNPDALPELPATPGLEGSGTVVASGGGGLGDGLVGKRVGVVGGSTWAEYAVFPATQCIPLPDNVSLEAGCGCFVNPTSVVGMVEIAKERNLKAIVHTAAASALGKMLVRHAKENGVEVICVVRREAQAQILRDVGATHIINSSEEGWEKTLADKCKELNALLAFEAIAGSMTGTILHAMPNNSEVMVYGALSEQLVGGIYPGDLIFQDKRVSSFWLTRFFGNKDDGGKVAVVGKVAEGLSGSMATSVRAKYQLDQLPEALKDYRGNMSGGKVLFAMGGSE